RIGNVALALAQHTAVVICPHSISQYCRAAQSSRCRYAPQLSSWKSLPTFTVSKLALSSSTITLRWPLAPLLTAEAEGASIVPVSKLCRRAMKRGASDRDLWPLGAFERAKANDKDTL